MIKPGIIKNLTLRERSAIKTCYGSLENYMHERSVTRMKNRMWKQSSKV